jgi:hypothetical protein
MNAMLKPGGKLYMSDVIFAEKDTLENISRLIRLVSPPTADFDIFQ